MKMNLEKIIPEVPWDFFGRFVPGLVIFIQLRINYTLPLEDSLLASSLAMLVASYLIGHLIQPFASRTEQLIAKLVRKKVIEQYNASKLRPAVEAQWPQVSDFRDIIDLPENFAHNCTIAQKKHAEAVSFFSIFLGSYFIWISAISDHFFKIPFLVISILLIWLLWVEFKLPSVVAFLAFLLASTLFWVINNFESVNYILVDPPHLSFLLSLTAAYCAYERTKNKINLEYRVILAYNNARHSCKLSLKRYDKE